MVGKIRLGFFKECVDDASRFQKLLEGKKKVLFELSVENNAKHFKLGKKIPIFLLRLETGVFFPLHKYFF